MTRDPLASLVDAPLFIVPRVLDGLRAYRQRPRPGNLGAQLDLLAGRLLEGVEAHPTRFWVMKQFRKTLEAVDGADTQAREYLATEFDTLMYILGIDDSDGVLSTL
jgi:hypothetical protein